MLLQVVVTIAGAGFVFAVVVVVSGDGVVVVAVVVVLASFLETGADSHSLPELFCPVSSELKGG